MAGVNPADLIATARELVSAKASKPKQAHLIRALSTAYYALFHALARCCADTMIGGPGSDSSKHAWRQVYRALDHKPASAACKRVPTIPAFPDEIKDFANAFAALQKKRHEADYDPNWSVYKSEVVTEINGAEFAINRLHAAPLKDRRAFAALVLFKTRD